MSAEYSPQITEILKKLEARQPLPPLAPEKAWDSALASQIQNASLEELFGDETIKGKVFGDAVKSGLLLWADALDASHTISQGISNKTGSYWHGIMHRREPDYGNSKYWFGRVGSHPIFPTLRKRVLDLLNGHSDSLADYAEAIQGQESWDAFQFVDWCQAEARNGNGERLTFLQTVQVEELKLLLDYSYRQALASH
jgi:hypothetical protein